MLIFDLLGGKTAIFAGIKAIIGLTIPANPQTGLLVFRMWRRFRPACERAAIKRPWPRRLWWASPGCISWRSRQQTNTKKGKKRGKRLAESIPSGRLGLFSFSFCLFFGSIYFYLIPLQRVMSVHRPRVSCWQGSVLQRIETWPTLRPTRFLPFALPGLFLVAFPASPAVLLLCHASLLASMNRCAAQLLQKTVPGIIIRSWKKKENPGSLDQFLSIISNILTAGI